MSNKSRAKFPRNQWTGPQSPKQRILDNIKIDSNGCWIWQLSPQANGYGRMSFTGGKQERAHRVSYREFKGEIPNDLCVLHKCDVRLCVNPDHLYLGTYKDNHRDAKERGRMTWSHVKKLTEEEVKEIRTGKLRQCDYADKFGISRQQVNSIMKRRSWKHV